MPELIHRHERSEGLPPEMPVENDPLHPLPETLLETNESPFGHDTLNVTPTKTRPLGSNVLVPSTALPSVEEDQELWSKTASLSLSSVYDTIASWWSGDTATVEETPISEPAPIKAIEATTQETSDMPSYYDGLMKWRGDMWSYLKSFVYSDGPPVQDADAAAKAESRPPIVEMSPQDRKELDRLLHAVNRLLSKVRETLSEAEFEELMETLMMFAQQSKVEDFHLQKIMLIKKQHALKDEQVKRLKDMDEHLEAMTRNKFWNDWDQLAASATLTSALAASGSPMGVAAAGGYIALKAVNYYTNNAIDPTLTTAKVYAWATAYMTGGNQKNIQHSAHQTLEAISGVATMGVSLAMGAFTSMRGISSVFQGLLTSIQSVTQLKRGLAKRDLDGKMGEMTYQGFRVKEAQEKVSRETLKLSSAYEARLKDWKALNRHQDSLHSAKIAMFR